METYISYKHVKVELCCNGGVGPCFHSPLHYKLTYTHIKHQELPNQRSHTEIEDDIRAFGHTSHSIVDGETELMNLHCTTTHDTTHTLLHEVRFLNAQTLGHVHSKAHYCWLGVANEILY